MRILVIGDSGKDVFLYGNCERLSPEAPVPIFTPIKSVVNDSMAGNVTANIRSLGISCDIITNPTGSIKTRYVDNSSNHMLLRMDENDAVHSVKEELNTIDYKKYDGIVISDYNKGYLSTLVIAHIASCHPLTFMDSKKQFGNWCDDIKFIKVNKKEYGKNYNYLSTFQGDVITTLGDKGATYKSIFYPTESEHLTRDLSGAGDTFLAAFVVEYLTSHNIPKSIQFANKCSSWAVTQRGVVVINPKMAGL